jgi:phage baseplate assembly protein V
MTGWMEGLMRLVRVRGLKEGTVQTARVEGFDPDTRDDVERFQDYGFAANPVEGEGLKFELFGTTFLLRLDRTAERPQLAAYEVCVWHKEGHSVTLKAGGVVQVDCTRYVVNASEEVVLNTPQVSGSGAAQFVGLVGSDVDVQAQGVSLVNHPHGGVVHGSASTDPPTPTA